MVRGVEQLRNDVAGWLARFSAPGAADDKVLAGYLRVVDFFSPHLGGAAFMLRTAPLAGAADVVAILGALEGGTAETQARALLLAGWLNWASGAQGWTTHYDTNDDGDPDLAFCLVMGRIEQVLGLWAPPASDLAKALDYAKSIFSENGEQQTGFSDVAASHRIRRHQGMAKRDTHRFRGRDLQAECPVTRRSSQDDRQGSRLHVTPHICPSRTS